jgi:hypothetical protein
VCDRELDSPGRRALEGGAVAGDDDIGGERPQALE